MNKVAKQSEDLYKEKIEQLRKIYPALFNDEGNLNEDELRSFLKQFASTSEGKYEFNWAGKMSAKRNAFTTSRAMLKPDKERSIDFDNTENLIIEGDNLEVLKLLQKSYQGKIKCIYIDPPYNTGNDFIYTDNFSEDKKAYWEKSGTTQDGVKLDTNTESQGRYHSNWLNMILSRLLIARNLITEDGAIFISIDDNEVHNLRKVMDEIFGEENFVAQVIWNRKRGRDNSAKWFSKSHEYLIIYSKNKDKFKTNNLELEDNTKRQYKNPDNDVRGIYRLLAVWARGTQGGVEYEFDTKDGQHFSKRLWLYSKDNLKRMDEENKLVVKGDNIYRKLFLDDNKGRIPETLWNDVSNAANASDEIKSIFEKIIFDTPKPVPYLKRIYKISTNENDIVLDFFAGSGTTAQAIMELNKEDGGNRKFILVQIPEKTDESSEAYKAGYKKISDICIERVKRVSNKLKEEKTEGDVGFKVFTLSPSYFPENLFTPDPEKTEEENKKALAKYIEEASTQLEFKFDEFDLMYEVLLKDGFTLNFKAEKLSDFTKNNIYKVTDGEKHAYVTLDGDLKDDTLQKLLSYTEERFICLERAVDTTKKWNLQNMFGSNLWVI